MGRLVHTFRKAEHIRATEAATYVGINLFLQYQVIWTRLPMGRRLTFCANCAQQPGVPFL